MAEFATWQAFDEFATTVRRKERYFQSAAVAEFLQIVLDTVGERRKQIDAGSVFYRAQLGFDTIEVEQDGRMFPDVAPFRPERMKPLAHLAKEGRINPKGIPYLYLASDANTAMSEVRPPLGDFVSLAHLKTNRDLRIVDCSADYQEDYLFYFEEPDPEERTRAVWRSINRAFSEPVNQDDDFADYVPTQVLAEYFKGNDFDGVVYKSRLGPRHNIALFDLEAADVVKCELHHVAEVTYSFKETATPVFFKPKSK